MAIQDKKMIWPQIRIETYLWLKFRAQCFKEGISIDKKFHYLIIEYLKYNEVIKDGYETQNPL